MYRFDNVLPVTVGTSAVSVKTHGQPVLIQNTHTANDLYIRDKGADGVEATSSNGWKIPAGGRTYVPVCFLELSIVGSGSGTTANVLRLEIG